MSRLSRIFTLAVVLVALIAALVVHASSAFATSQLIYSDEFNGPLDSSMWQKTNPWYLLASPSELEYYDPADTYFDGSGNLVLKSEARSMSGHSYTSGIISSVNHAKFSYGYFEMRAKLPAGKGIWPAFWLVGDGLEIDQLEMIGDRPSRIFQTLHIGDSQVYQGIKDGPDYSAGYHTYGLDWQPTYVRWYIDGVMTADYEHATPNIPQTICFNTAVGGAWPGSPDSSTKFPCNFSIDYLRVYSSKPTANVMPVTNTAPIANDDAYTATSNSTLRVTTAGLLANDTDTEGGTLKASLASGASHGSVSVNSDGSFSYTPASGYWGLDSFTYHVSDGSLTSADARVSIVVAAAGKRRPSAASDSYTVVSGRQLAVAAPGVVVNDSADGSALSVELSKSTSHGKLSLAENGSFTYTPNSGFSGTDSFTYVASDGENVSDLTKVVLSVAKPTVVTKPSVRRRTSHMYRVSGKVRYGARLKTTSSSGITANHVIMKMYVQRLVSGCWKPYKTLTLIDPASAYRTNVRLAAGGYRVMTSVYGNVPAADSRWSRSFRVR